MRDYGPVAIVHDENADQPWDPNNPKSSVPAYVVHGQVMVAYRANGGSAGFLGPPTSDEFVNENGLPQSNFRGGYITFNGSSWQAYTWPGAGNDWHATYYNNPQNWRIEEFKGGPTMVRNRTSLESYTVDFNYGDGAPYGGKNGVFADHFAVRWEKTETFTQVGTYHLQIFSDDGVRLSIGGSLAIDSWKSGGNQCNDVYLYLLPGVYTLRLDYFEDVGPAYVKLSWHREAGTAAAAETGTETESETEPVTSAAETAEVLAQQGDACPYVPPVCQYAVGAGSSRQQLFLNAYNRNGGMSKLGCATSGAHWWGPVVAQDFTGSSGFGEAIILQDESHDNPPFSIPAYVVHGDIWVTYRNMGGPASWLGVPTSDEFVNGRGYPQSNFTGGYITWNGSSWQAYYSSQVFRSFQSVNYPGEYIRHMNSLGEKTTVVSDLDKKDATFRVVPGLADPTCVSLEAKNYPGYFLRHQESRVKLHPNDNTQLFKEDATFCIRPGLSYSSAVSFESRNFPGRYLRHRDGHLWVEAGDGSALYRQDATWRMVNPWWP